MKFLVVGAGLTGGVISRQLADSGHEVEVIERRDHIGGNCYDYTDDNGIILQKYGPHIFHTYKREIVDFISRYDDWSIFYVKGKVFINDRYTSSPFNFQTVEDYFGKESDVIIESLKKEYPDKKMVSIIDLFNSDNEHIRRYADFLFEKDYRPYTAKQWGMDPSKVDKSVLSRAPIRLSYSEGCVDDTYQLVPTKGFTSWFSHLLDHPKIHIHLKSDVKDYIKSIEENNIKCNDPSIDFVIYTGPIDELFGFIKGKLPYRTTRFEWCYKDKRHYLPEAISIYPEEEYTRITDYSYFPQLFRRKDCSVLSYEYPVPYRNDLDDYEPYYPVLTNESMQLRETYMSMASKINNLVCCGRLGSFRYYNMDQALEAALEISKKIIEKYGTASDE